MTLVTQNDRMIESAQFATSKEGLMSIELLSSSFPNVRTCPWRSSEVSFTMQVPDRRGCWLTLLRWNGKYRPGVYLPLRLRARRM
jgi:hypothetical protein